MGWESLVIIGIISIVLAALVVLTVSLTSLFADESKGTDGSEGTDGKDGSDGSDGKDGSDENDVNRIGITHVAQVADLPASDENGIITLQDEHTYYITQQIDLGTRRLVAGRNTTILGSSSEVSSLTSELSGGQALLTSSSSLPLRHLTLSVTGPGQVLDLDASDENSTAALDVFGVNFRECHVGRVANYNNTTWTSCAFINIVDGLTFDGTINSIVMSQCLLTVGTGGTAITLPNSLTIGRRLRVIYSSLVIQSGATGLDVHIDSVPLSESYILDTCNFSGPGTYLTGVDHTSNSTLFVNNVGITNTSVNGQMYMNNNAVITTLSLSDTFYPVLGATLPSPNNAKYEHINYTPSGQGRLTNQAIIPRSYLVTVTVSLNGNNNATYTFGIYDSTLADVRVPSQTSVTTSSGGRAESVHLACVVQHKKDDFIEAWVSGPQGSVTVTDMNVIIIQL